MSRSQRVVWVRADVTDYADVQQAFAEAERRVGAVPEFVFACAGSARPGFFLEQPASDFADGMRLNYLGAVHTLKVGAGLLVAAGLPGRLVLVSSTVGLMGMVGYSQYAPTKFAVRGLGECLRQEMLPHRIKVHVYFVSTIETPGYARENATKPAITALIEGADSSDKSPGARARTLLTGMQREQFMITSDLATDMLRVAAAGATRTNYWLKDVALLLVGWLAIPVWRVYADYLVCRGPPAKAE